MSLHQQKRERLPSRAIDRADVDMCKALCLPEFLMGKRAGRVLEPSEVGEREGRKQTVLSLSFNATILSLENGHISQQRKA